MLSFFHIITTTSTISTPPQNIYLVVALNFRSDYRLRTHQWIERGNFDFSDPFSSVYKCHNRPLHALVTLLILVMENYVQTQYLNQ